MKANHVIPPAAALVLVLAWNAIEATSLQRIGSEAATLKQAIAEARDEARDEARARESREMRSVPEGGFDWKRISASIGSAREDGVPVAPGMTPELQDKIAEMNAEEILAALDQIDSPGSADAGRGEMEAMLFEALVEIDPSQALNRFVDRIGDDDDAVGWQLALAMAEWAKRDSTAAAAWLDQQIEAGAFEARSLDGHSHARIEFEGALVAELLTAKNTAAAGARISMLPEQQRREALEQISFSQLDPVAMQAYTQLVRDLVPRDERDASFTHMASDLVRSSGFDGVDRFLDRVEAMPEERAVAAREAANTRLEEIANDRTLTRKDVDDTRLWVENQSPGNTDGITGEALAAAAQSGGNFNFESAAELALDYHRGSSSDDVLISFLESFAASSNPAQAVALAEHIRDAARRKEIIEEFE